jgi:hypothetical protein
LAVCLPRAPIAPVKDHLPYCFKNPAVLEWARQDPVRYKGGLRLGTAFELQRACLRIQSLQARITTPFLLLHGDKDVVTSWSISEAFYHGAGSTDKTMVIYEGAYHVLWWEPAAKRKEIYADMVQWMVDRIGGKHDAVERIDVRKYALPADAPFEIPGEDHLIPWSHHSKAHLYDSTHPSKGGPELVPARLRH